MQSLSAFLLFSVPKKFSYGSELRKRYTLRVLLSLEGKALEVVLPGERNDLAGRRVCLGRVR